MMRKLQTVSICLCRVGLELILCNEDDDRRGWPNKRVNMATITLGTSAAGSPRGCLMMLWWGRGGLVGGVVSFSHSVKVSQCRGTLVVCIWPILLIGPPIVLLICVHSDKKGNWTVFGLFHSSTDDILHPLLADLTSQICKIFYFRVLRVCVFKCMEITEYYRIYRLKFPQQR